MKQRQAIDLLLSLPGPQQVAIREWMDAFDITDEQLTLPLLRFLAGASEVEDERVRQVLRALLEQERVELAMTDRWAPAAVLH